MSAESDFESVINVIRERFSDPEITKILSGFTKTIQLEFPDKGVSYVIELENGQLKAFEQKSIESPDIKVTMNSDVFIGVINKTLSPVKAYMSGKIKVKGAMSDLLKLRKVLF